MNDLLNRLRAADKTDETGPSGKQSICRGCKDNKCDAYWLERGRGKKIRKCTDYKKASKGK